MAACTKEDVILALLPMLEGQFKNLVAQQSLVRNAREKLNQASKIVGAAHQVSKALTKAYGGSSRDIRAIATEIAQASPALDAQTRAFLDAQVATLPDTVLANAFQVGLGTLSYVPQTILGQRAGKSIATAIGVIAALVQGGSDTSVAYLSHLVRYALDEIEKLEEALDPVRVVHHHIGEILFFVYDNPEGEVSFGDGSTVAGHLRTASNTMDTVVAQLETGFFNNPLFLQALTYGEFARDALLPDPLNRPLRSIGGRTRGVYEIAQETAYMRTLLTEMSRTRGQLRARHAAVKDIISTLISYDVEWKTATETVLDANKEVLEAYRLKTRALGNTIEKASVESLVTNQGQWATEIQGSLSSVSSTYTPGYRRSLQAETVHDRISTAYAEMQGALIAQNKKLEDEKKSLDYDPLLEHISTLLADVPGVFYGVVTDRGAASAKARALQETLREGQTLLATTQGILSAYTNILSQFPLTTHALVDSAFSTLQVLKMGGWQRLLQTGKLAELTQFNEATVTSVGQAIFCLNSFGSQLTPDQQAKFQRVAKDAQADREAQEARIIVDGDLQRRTDEEIEFVNQTLMNNINATEKALESLS